MLNDRTDANNVDLTSLPKVTTNLAFFRYCLRIHILTNVNGLESNVFVVDLTLKACKKTRVYRRDIFRPNSECFFFLFLVPHCVVAHLFASSINSASSREYFRCNLLDVTRKIFSRRTERLFVSFRCNSRLIIIVSDKITRYILITLHIFFYYIFFCYFSLLGLGKFLISLL